MRILKVAAVVVAVIMAVGCVPKPAKLGDQAVTLGDWDSAVVYYRQALGKDPDQLDVRVKLERAMRTASENHMKRARDLEAQNQMAGAAAEYRLAADLDPSNGLAFERARQIEKQLRALIEANRPPSNMDQLRTQIAQNPNIPRLDPRIRIPLLRFNASVREILTFIGTTANINVTYDAQVPNLSTLYPVDLSDVSLEEALNTVLTSNGLTFKVISPKAIFIYADTQAGHQKWDDVYIQTFYVSHGDLTEINAILTQMVLQGPAVRPIVQPNKTARTLVARATLPVLELIATVIDANDKPKAEVMVDLEILEVDRTRARKLGVDLGSFALNFVYSPEVVPGNIIPGTQSPNFNVNTPAQGGIRTSDFYMNVPTAQIRLLESDVKTRVLAKPQLRGQEGAALTLNLGDRIPYASTTFSAAGGGFGNTNVLPAQVTYEPIGVNVSMIPFVTYADEIVLQNLNIDKSGLGPTFIVQGSPQPSFVRRQALVTLRLRDGESNLLAGLIREDDKKLWTTLPGISNIPVLRELFGNRDTNLEQSDIVMIVTPHIVRGHDISADDLRPRYAGMGTNIGSGTAPRLISPDAPPPAPVVNLTGPPAAGATAPPAAGAPPATTTTPPPATTGATPPARAVGVVPVEPAGGAAAPAAAAPAQFEIGLPTGDFVVGGGPYTVTVRALNAPALSTVSLVITYNPAVLKATMVSQGTLMQQGGIAPTFVPQIDATTGRVSITITRPNDRTGASGNGPLAAIMFEPVAEGTSQIGLSGAATAVSGPAPSIRMQAVSVVVKK